jgi:hypothetical protein
MLKKKDVRDEREKEPSFEFSVYKLIQPTINVPFTYLSLLRRPRRRWEDNIKTILQEVGGRGVDQIVLDQNREKWWALANAVMNLRVTLRCGEFVD